MALDTYGHVFDDLGGAKPISAEQAIRKARAEARVTLVASYAESRSPEEKPDTADCGDFVRAFWPDANRRRLLQAFAHELRGCFGHESGRRHRRSASPACAVWKSACPG
jgi:hypothetical protein